MAAPIDAKWAVEALSPVNLNATTYGQGTSFPSTWPVDRIFWRTDTNLLYKNIGTEGTPVWELITQATLEAGETSVFPHTTTIGDYASPSAAVATSEADLSGRIKDNGFDVSSTTGWNDNVFTNKFTLGANDPITGVRLDVSVASGNVRVKVYDDTGSGGDAGALLGESGSLSVSSTGKQLFALTGTAPASGVIYAGFEATSGVGLRYKTGETRHLVLHTFGAGPDPFGTATKTVGSQPFIGVEYTGAAGASSAIDDNTADTHRWQSNSEVAPAIYVDTGSNKEWAALAIWWNSASTVTEVKIRISTDVTFTDSENVRTITVTDLTAGQYNFIRFNRLPEDRRYLQIIGTDGGSLVMSINEIKILNPSAADFNRKHGHVPISSSDTALDLDGT